jgi:23S rRNA (cytosine1962-C5)-methyltransferase
MRATIAEVAAMSDSVTASVAALPALRLKRNEDRRLAAGHLWVFSNEVDTAATPLGKFRGGDLVRVVAHNDRALGIAYVNPKSLICARLLASWQLPDVDWFTARLRTALVLRQRLYAAPYYRLVYGEADGLPGLVIDRYGDSCVMQIGTAGMERLREPIVAALNQVLAPRQILLKNDSAARELEGLPAYVEVIQGTPPDYGDVVEDGISFRVPLLAGQKTGWFFDQAANRRSLVKYIAAGARVLDLFSYVGAWGIRAGKSGAHLVTCVDASATALELAVDNGRRNGVTLTAKKADAFEALEEYRQQRARFDVIIVDPPAFAKKKKDLPKAQAAYKRLNQMAMQLMADDGFLISCSCSYHLSGDDLLAAIGKAARAAQRPVQIVEVGGQAPDHPVHPAIAESRYLKAFFCRVGAVQP